VEASFPAKPRIAVCGEPRRDQCVNKRADMVSRFFRHPFVKAADLIKEFIYGALPIKEFPDVDAGGVQTKTTKTNSRIGVEEHGPVVKLFPERDEGVGYGLITVLHRSSLPPLRNGWHDREERVKRTHKAYSNLRARCCLALSVRKRRTAPLTLVM
jgi:hypothetical protein